MSTPPPRRGPVAPPRGAPPQGLTDGEVVGIRRPAGPPPGMVNLSLAKPPPHQPPISGLSSGNASRPGVEGVMKRASPLDAEDVLVTAAAMKNLGNHSAGAKAGGISMFQGPSAPPRFAPPSEPPPDADSKSGLGPLSPSKGRAFQPLRPLPRPLPPRGQLPPGISSPGAPPPSGPPPRGLPRGMRPPPPRETADGIPDYIPDAPTEEYSKQDPTARKAPPPIYPPPLTQTGKRAPPEMDPEEERRRRLEAVRGVKTASHGPLRGEVDFSTVHIDPPTTPPPNSRNKIVHEAEYIPRRERENPELENSDDERSDEEPEWIKQPKPFGVIKEALPFGQRSPEAERPITPVKMHELNSSASVASSFAPSIAPSSQRPIPDSIFSEVMNPATLKLDSQPESKLAKILPVGRLLIKCLEGHEIRRKGDTERIPRNDVYLRFRLSAAERHPWKQTTIRRKQDTNPQFENEVVFFDVADPADFILNDDIQLCIEMYHRSASRAELIGSVQMSVARFFKMPYVAYTESVPIYYVGDTRTPMRLSLEFVFEEARSGMIEVIAYEANELRNIDPMSMQSPYVQFNLGKHYQKRIASVKRGGTNPVFEHTPILLWVDQENWVHNLQVSVLDEDSGDSKPIGTTSFSLLPYMKLTDENTQEEEFDLFYTVNKDPRDSDSQPEEIACGTIILRVRFYPAGKLRVFIDRAKNLQLPIGSGVSEEHMDPYVMLTLDSQAVQIVKRSASDKDGGKDPVWENSLFFDVVDQHQMDVRVMSQVVGGKDVLIGYATVSLLNCFRKGEAEFWVSLKQKKANGGVREVGDLLLRLSFSGPVGVAYPQYTNDVDRFDDTIRKAVDMNVTEKSSLKPTQNASRLEEVTGESSAPMPISTIPDDEPIEEALKKLAAQKEFARRNDVPPEFTEDEIIAAFKFIDLDHSNYISAKEIRHILVCMGELITDEEIDMMISMVDMDGDGQVSFKEFRTLVLHPNPGIVDLHKEVSEERNLELMQEKQALAGKTQGLDLTSFHRQKEMLQREQKKRMLLSFIEDNEVTFATLQHSYENFRDLPDSQKINQRVDFDTFCAILRVETITEYRNLHKFYDDEETGRVDMREILLSMLNFVDVSREDRLRLSFQMFDQTKTGYITQRDIEEILRGNHLLTLASVKRKAETIMKQVTENGQKGAISLREFLVIAKKFPNILFPNASVLEVKKKVALIPSSGI